MKASPPPPKQQYANYANYATLASVAASSAWAIFQVVPSLENKINNIQTELFARIDNVLGIVFGVVVLSCLVSVGALVVSVVVVSRGGEGGSKAKREGRRE